MTNHKIDELQNLTLNIYYLLVNGKNKKFGVNEVRKLLNLEARSKAFYHLNKLYQMDLVQKTSDNQYYVNHEDVSQKILNNYIYVVSRWIPKSFLFVIVGSILGVLNLTRLFINFNLNFLLILNFVVFVLVSIFHLGTSKNLSDQLKINN